MEPDNLETQSTKDPLRFSDGRWIPLSFHEGEWKPQTGWRKDDYVPTIPISSERYGLMLDGDSDSIFFDLDPKNNEHVFSEMRPWLEDTAHRQTKGNYNSYLTAEHCGA